jgi:hypothetical protein
MTRLASLEYGDESSLLTERDREDRHVHELMLAKLTRSGVPERPSVWTDVLMIAWAAWTLITDRGWSTEGSQTR